MSIRDEIQAAMKAAMKSKDTVTLEALRMAKGAIMLKEKETGKALSQEDEVAALRGEVKKRRQSIEIFREHGKHADADQAEREIEAIERFLPRQLSREELEGRVRAFLAEHSEIDHAGRLTGALKKELGDQADGKMLNEVCQAVLIEK